LSLPYFAYGANMAQTELDLVAPHRRFLGPARLEGFQLAFRRRSIRWGGGAADIVESPRDEVWGALFELGEGGLEALDAKEGEGLAYQRCEVEVLLGDDRRAALAYQVIDKEPADVPPTPEYLALLLAGARECGLPHGYRRRLEQVVTVGGPWRTSGAP
jgi:gamma-glutamylcyclotransferase